MTDSPGMQMSSSIGEAKSHDTFICEYKLKNDSIINGILVTTIFAEKQFWKDGSFFLKKHIDCCSAQLVIISKVPFSLGNTGYGLDWKIDDFRDRHSYCIYKEYKSINLPDSVNLNIIDLKGKDSMQIVKKIKLYRLK